MSEKIAPAARPFEWEDGELLYPTVSFEGSKHPGHYKDRAVVVWDGEPMGASVTVAEHDRHALAAFCLHGKLFGFDRQDVACLRGIAASHAERATAEPENIGPWMLATLLGSIADRIEALLPPDRQHSDP